MVVATRRTLVCLGCCMAALVGSPVAALGEESLAGGSPSVGDHGTSSVLTGSLVIAGSPTEGEQRRAQSEARRESPEVFAMRVQSRTMYEGLGVQAGRVDRAVFPGLLERQVGGMPRLPTGVRLVKYAGPTAAQLELPGGRHGALESTSVIARPEADGRFGPVELGLERSGKQYRPRAPVVAVGIPERLSEGVSAPASGVSLVPVDARGLPLHAAEGSLQGASVLYSNSATDTDTVAKPTSTGFELDAILRSERSPRTLYYKVRMPRGAHLAQRSNGQVEIAGAHGEIGHISPPAAQGANGAAVSVTMNVAGDTLAVRVGGADEAQWPIEVDPEYWAEDTLSPGWEECPLYGVCTRGMHNWQFITSNGHIFEMDVEAGYFWPVASYNGGEYAGIQYQTQGESEIWAFETKTTDIFGYNEETNIDLIKPNGHGGYEPEAERKLINSEKSQGMTICGVEHTEAHTCETTEGYPGNIARFMTNTTATGNAHTFVSDMEEGHVYLAQEKGPSVAFITLPPSITVNGTARTNILHGSGAWLSPYSGAIGISANDPGIGIYTVKLNTGGTIQEVGIHREGKCAGLRCEKLYIGSFTYSPKMKNGEQSANLIGEDGVGLWGEATTTVKVDASKPYNLGLTGMPEAGAEISAAPHVLTVHATDGTKPTPSSGIRSISVSIDGATPTEVSGASCPAGECTASGEYTLHAESLTEGVHRLVMDAVSNSGEPGAKEFLFDVRHAGPVSVGPGSVDPTTGQLTLTASDVSLGGASGVSRSYQSRNLTAGTGGPLGPQWAMSVGGGEGLTVLPSGSVVLVSGSGGATTFTLNAKGEFEAPKGDENLKIEYKAAEHRYVLKDATAGSETVFEQPTGMQSTPPTFGDAFGAEAGVLNQPVSVALDASSDLWITDWVDDRVTEYSKTGALIATYGSEGAESGQFSRPWGIAVNQGTGNVYVTDDGNSRIVELSSSGTFIRAIGWGVSNAKPELQTCTSSCLAGIAGTGAGQLDWPQGVSIDSSGDLWVAEYNSNRVQEFSETGSYITTFGSAGSGAGQFEGPMNIAFTSGDVYVTDQNNNRVDEFSTAGSFVKTIGWGVANGEERLETCTSSCRAGITGTGNGQFSGPRGLTVDPVSGNLYVSEINNNRVQELTTSGSFVAKFGAAGSGPGQFAQPMGVAAASTGAIYVTDFEHARVQEWMRPTWLPTSAKGALPAHTTYTYTPVENSEGVISMQPYEVISPTPQGVECGTKAEELKEEKDKGCRALTFKYAAETTAKGENPTEWGEYKGHLSQVTFHAWNPSAKAMEEKAVAQYSYDKLGRLRTEWDPRIEKSAACGGSCAALKATYGYDSEGHVTSLTPPGQQSWAFSYGTIAGDPNAGRLLKVTRAPASAALWNGEATKNTALPKLSGAAVVGVTMGVSNGTWTNGPVAYGYQWEDCNSEGKSCMSILGATNADYKITASDVGYKLVAQVGAINGAGAVVTVSAASAVVTSSGTKTEGEVYSPGPGSTIEYHVPVSGSGAPYTLSREEVEKWGQKDNSENEDNDPVEGMAVFPPDEPQGWPASDYKRATIDYMNAKGLTVNTAIPSGGISTTEFNGLNEAVRTLSPDNQAAALKEGCESVKEHKCKAAEVSEKLDTKTEYNPEGSDVLKVLGPEHTVKLSAGEEVKARAVTHNYYDEGAGEAEERNKEAYNLITKSTSAALLPNGEEKDVRTSVTSYSGQGYLGWKLRKPTSVTKDPGGLNLTTTTEYDPATGNVVQTKAPKGAVAYSQLAFTSTFGSKGKENGQFEFPTLSALTANGSIWVVDSSEDRVQEFNLAKNEYQAQFGSAGTGGGQFKFPFGIAIEPSNGNIVVGDREQGRIEVFSSTGSFIRTFGWGVSNGEAKFENCTKECRAGLRGGGTGELENPDGIALDSSGNVWVVDETRDRVEEYSEAGEFIKQFGVKGSEPGQINQPVGLALDKGNLYLTEVKNERVQEFSTSGSYLGQFGSEGSGLGQFKTPYAIAVVPGSGDLYVTDRDNNRVEKFTTTGVFVSSFGAHGKGSGQFEAPTGVVSGEGEVAYVSDHNNQRVQKWTPAAANAHQAKVIYYTAEEEAEVTACRNHPEWVGLVCQTEPAVQPVSGTALPITTAAAYNIWDDTEKTEEKFGTGSKAVTRTKTETYDPAGRAVTSEETASPETGKSLPKVTDEYNAETGALEKQSTSEGTVTSKANTLGQQIEYKDASGNVAKYVYEEGSDGRLEEVSEGKGEEAKSSQTYSYNATTGLMEKLVDSAAGTFKAGYDAEGKMTSETYPNNMTATTTFNPLGQATSLIYEKNANCASKCPETWFSDSVVPSIHGETLQQTSTLSKENYAYDNAGRLLETQETPAGKGCVVRLYAYEEESNRTSEIKREPGTEGKCATEGGTVERHTYDEANRLTDEGIEYETFGDTTKMPSSDAGGHEIVSTYYVDNQVATEKQNEQMLKYMYDPAGRTMETVTENEKTKTKTTTVSHYAGSGNALTWASEGPEKWTRNIPGIDGVLDAVQEAGKTPTLQLHDLQGNIVGSVEDSEAATKLASTYNSIEFGVPNEGKTPPKYAWLGATGVSTEPSQGAGTSTQGGASYVPEVARTLQTAPAVPPGAFPNGSPGTQTTAVVSPAALAYAQEQATQVWQRAEVARQKAWEEERKSHDPSWEFYLWNTSEVYRLSTYLHEAYNVSTTLAQRIDYLSEVVGVDFAHARVAGGAEGEILESSITTAEVNEWYNQFITGLQGCKYEMTTLESLGASSGECFVAVTTEIAELNDITCIDDGSCYEVPLFTWFPGVAFAWGGSSWWMNSGRVENPIAGPPYWGNP